MGFFRFLTAGESHGPALTAIVSGVPAGLRLDRDALNRELARRQGGYGRGGRMQIERDEVEITAGLRNGESLGSPIALVIRNRDYESWRGAMDPWEGDAAEMEKRRVHSPRPGHADLAGGMKFRRTDLRDVLERASARETAVRVAAGAVARQLLATVGIEIRSATLSLGSAGDPLADPSWETMVAIADDAPLRAADPKAEEAMVKAVDAARQAGDTLGGTLLVVARGVPPGLGSHVSWDAKLDGRIGQAILSIPAVKAIGFGIGAEAARLAGSEVHDAIVPGGALRRASNRAGGLEAGITNGEEIRIRVAMKPIATLRRGVASVDLDSGAAQRSQWERSDVTAVPACGVICEAMLAIVLADAAREKFGGDSLEEMLRNHRGYLDQLEAWLPKEEGR